MNNFSFEYPYFFLLLLLIICIYRCPVIIKKIFFPHIHLFTKVSHWIHKEKLLYSLIFFLLVTALASPISYDAKLSQHRKGRDLVFVLDSSGSMGESGFSQENRSLSRYTLLKNIISNFIQARYDDNVGIVPFGSFAFASVPLTYDMHAVSFLLTFLEVGIAGENTAIGDGLINAIALLDKSYAKNKVIILITDGRQNSGSHSIKEAVEQAKLKNIKIYTIGIGKKRDFDAILLHKISTQTQGTMFSAKNAETLQEVYTQLDTLEPSPIRSQNYLNKELLFNYPLLLAMLLLFFILSKRGKQWFS